MKRILLIVLCMGLGMGVHAQDMNFTQWDLAPFNINPAHSGAFYGSYRLHGIYRDRWAGTFNTLGFAFDMPIPIKSFKKDWIGGAISVYQDEAGSDASIVQTSLAISGAYHLAFDKKRKNVLSLGLGWHPTPGRRIKGDPQTASDILAGSTSMGGILQDKKAEKYNDFEAGAMLFSTFNKAMSMRLGVGVKHLFGPKYSLNGISDEKQPARIAVHGQFLMELSEKVDLMPGFIFQTMGPQNEIGIQGILGYDLKTDWKLNGGLAYRLRDAASLIGGVVWKENLRVGLAYDLTLSEAATLGDFQNSFELGMSYIIKVFKKPEPPAAIFCPRF